MLGVKLRNNRLYLILAILLICGIILLGVASKSISRSDPQSYVSRIVDGDTFDLSTGERVRLICVDTPEINQEGYDEAKEFLKSMIFNKRVRLEKDISETDKYGRLLRYVYVNISGDEIFVNKELFRKGYGEIFRYGNDTRRCNEIEGLD